jgi:predicted Zn-dependent peptidase
VAGNTTTAQVKELSEKWFAGIPAGEKYIRQLPAEPKQTAPRKEIVKANVPLDALYKCWHMEDRLDDGYYAAELITDILSGGGSSRLYQSLVKEQQLFSNIECYHFGSTDAGILTIEGKLVKGVKMEDADKAVEAEMEKIKNTLIDEKELQKVKNKTEAALAFEDMSIMNRASSLATYELLGNPALINEELNKYQSITREDIRHYARKIFDVNNSNTLYYYAEEKS